MNKTGKEKPIIFSTPMVQAILEGRKTQTRRVMKPQFIDSGLLGSDYWFYGKTFDDDNKTDIGISWHKSHAIPQAVIEKARYQVGDILWVRETYMSVYNGCDGDGIPYVPKIVYKADFNQNLIIPEIELESARKSGHKWRSSMFMPKEAARIWLRLTGVRVERLQEISEADAMAEGVKPEPPFSISPYKRGYAILWNSLHKKDGYIWDTNPWVMVYEFERTDGVKA